MSSNERLLAAAYGEGDREEQRLLHSRAGEMEFQYTVRLAQRYMDPTKSVVEIGCATGRYGMYFADQCQAYLGVDLLPAHVERFARKIREKGLKNVRAMVGDATRLDGVADESCDVVLALGPMYHLPRAERKLVFQECRRICRQGGVLLFSFANQAGAYFNGCLRLSNAGYYPNKAVNEIVLKRGESDQNPGLFYLTMPEKWSRLPRNAAYGFCTAPALILLLATTVWRKCRRSSMERGGSCATSALHIPPARACAIMRCWFVKKRDFRADNRPVQTDEVICVETV